MYMNDDLRRAVKHNRPASHVHSCGITENNPNQPSSPRRFDGTVVTLPKFMKGNEFLTHEDLSIGQKQYIWGIARIYSVSNMMQLKQRQYQSLLDYDFNRRIQNKDLKEQERKKEWREYIRYSKFIKRQDLVIKELGMKKRWKGERKMKSFSNTFTIQIRRTGCAWDNVLLRIDSGASSCYTCAPSTVQRNSEADRTSVKSNCL